MIGEYFYHKSLKKIISTFGSLFSDVIVMTGNDQQIKVPIHYAHKQKFLEIAANNSDVRNMVVDTTLPIMGFEITSYAYAPERMTNPMNIQNIKNVSDTQSSFIFTSIPYNVSIEPLS